MKPELYETFSAVEDRHWWFCARRKYIRRLTERFVAPGDGNTFCEIGCGTGGNLPMLAREATVDAVEMDDYGRACAIARNVEGVRTIEAGSLPNELPFSGPYQAVYSLDVIEHLREDCAAVRAMGELLSGDGTLFLTVPAYQWMWSYHDEANHHIRRYTRGELCRVVEEAGLQVVYSSYFNTILAPLAIAARFADKFVGMFRSPRGSIGLEMPPAWINRILAAIFGLERHLAGRVSAPFGLSIVVVAKNR
jgi:SAM-dependent methyltransferase